MKRMRQPNSARQKVQSEGRPFTHSPVHPSPVTRHPSLVTRHPSGFTLLEVLIATGILVFGVLAIIRIFPAGLGVIERNQNFTTAARLAEDMNERFTRQKDQLPDAVIGVDTSGGFVTDIDPESTPDDPAPNSVDGMKRVVGEQHEVLSNGSILVNFPQIATPVTNADPELQNPRVYLSEPETILTEGTDFTLPSGATIHFIRALPVDPTYYRVSYKFINKTDATRTYHAESVRVKRTGTSADVSVPGESVVGSSNFQLISGSVRVVEETPVTTFSMSDDQRKRGVISTGLAQGKEVKVDYTVDDWRWVSETEIIPDSLVVDLIFNDVLENKGMYVAQAQSGDSISGGTVDYRKGTVTYPSTSALQNTPVRLTYWTGLEWVLQLQKAPATFTNVTPSDTTNLETYRQFADRFWQDPFGSGSNSQDLDGDGTQDQLQYLGFRQCNAGRTVVVDYVDNNSPYTTYYGELHTIGETAPTTPVYPGLPYQIKLFHPYREIVSVRGVSMTSRVLWIDKGTFRHVEVPTYLARN